MRAERQTDKQTYRHADRSTSLLYPGRNNNGTLNCLTYLKEKEKKGRVFI